MEGGNYTLKDLNKYDVNADNAVEKVRQTLYDAVLYPTAGVAGQLTFFSNPVGQGVTTAPGAAVGSAKTKSDTNMTIAGALPSPQAFIVESIELLIFPGASGAANTFTLLNPIAFLAVAAATFNNGGVQDVNVIGASGFLDFTVGSKSYLTEAPLGRFPGKTYLGLDAAIASNSATTAEVGTANAKWAGRPYYLTPQITLRATQNFSVTANWPGLVPTPSGFNARIICILDGVLFRKAQ